MKRRAFLRRAFLSILALAAAAVPMSFALGQAQKPMKIGVIGSGRIGSTLGGLWAKAGHEVMFSDRDLDTAKAAAQATGARARTGTVEEAVAVGDALLIALPPFAPPPGGQQGGAPP